MSTAKFVERQPQTFFLISTSQLDTKKEIKFLKDRLLKFHFTLIIIK